MVIPDVNILVNAFRRDAEHHATCHAWMDELINGVSQFGLASNALSGFLRIVTHPKIFQQPSPLDEAIAFCDILLDCRQSTIVSPGIRHWTIFADLCRSANTRGNLIPDAWFAALAIEHGCEWITLDRDFARFPALKWSVPS